MSRMSRRPLSSPIGRAPAEQNLMPLYWAGLCDAVNIAPGASREPEAKYNRSVEPRPRSTTSSPWLVTPSPNAATMPTPDGRMSRATSTRVAPGWALGHEAGEGHADRPGDPLVELLGDHAPHVVGLEDGIQVRHGARA